MSTTLPCRPSHHSECITISIVSQAQLAPLIHATRHDRAIPAQGEGNECLPPRSSSHPRPSFLSGLSSASLNPESHAMLRIDTPFPKGVHLHADQEGQLYMGMEGPTYSVSKLHMHYLQLEGTQYRGTKVLM